MSQDGAVPLRHGKRPREGCLPHGEPVLKVRKHLYLPVCCSLGRSDV